MSQNINGLQAIVNLARGASSETRHQLLDEITELFLRDPDRFSDSEATSLGNIICAIIKDVEVEGRQQLAVRMSEVETAPHNLIVALANDEIEVSTPILQNSELLTDQDLAQIIRLHGKAHLAAIAQRKPLNDELTANILEHANEEIIDSLLENDEADFSRSTFEMLAERAKTNPHLQEALAARQDFPPDLLNRMYFYGDEELKHSIMQRNAQLDDEQIDQILIASEDKDEFDEDISQESLTPAEKFILEKERSDEFNEQLMVSLLRDHQMKEFIAGFSRISGLQLKTAQQVIQDSSAEPLAIACRAAEIERSTFSTIVLLSDEFRSDDPERTHELLSLYDKVDDDTAKRTMRFWRML